MGKLNQTTDFLVGLFAEKSSDNVYRASVGRLAFWSAFIPALYIWGQTGTDIQPHHQIILLALLTYNVSKHGLKAIKRKDESS